MVCHSLSTLAGLALLFPSAIVALAHAKVSSCPTTVSASVPAPSVAKGYTVRLVGNGLSTPRGITFDSAGNLLVVQSGVGIEALTLADAGGACVTVASQKTVVSLSSLNHGITFSADGKTLYASDSESVYMWSYNASTASTTSSATTIITNMTNSDHVTRTLYMSKFEADTLIVARGSGDNVDPVSAQLSSGRAQVRAFNLATRTGVYNYPTDGKVLGWGLRNDVGVDEHPVTGGIWTVENGADNLVRQGVDVHQNNPGEKLNYLGTLLKNTSPNQGASFGYPTCFGVYNLTVLPDNGDLKVGELFAINTLSATNNDTLCKAFVAPRLVFQAHMAPLDILFNSNGSQAWVTFHGSWDRSPPVGYKISLVNFNAQGQPLAQSNSHTAAKDIIKNQDSAGCPTNCFRPVGLVWDTQGRLFWSSDATGEIYVTTGAAN